MKKSALFIVLFFIGFANIHSIKSANYYFSSSSGDDANTEIQATRPKTPWKSLAKLNTFFENLKPGDSVLLKRGDLFEGTLRLASSGQHQNPIVISAYGEGHSPIISGWKKISSWTAHTKTGIWSANTSRTTPLNLVTLGDDIEEKGRFPNDGFLEYNVTENGLIILQSDINPKDWESGTLVMRKNQWIIDKVTPKEYTSEGFKLEANMRYPPKSGFGLFIQDNLNTLDKEGEWYHDDDRETLYLYLSKSNPNSREIKIGMHDHLITNKAGIQHIKILDLCFSGANRNAIQLEKAFNIDISQCTIEFTGENALYAVDVPNIKITKNKIYTAMNSGIFLRYGTPNSIVSDNDISDVHPFFGMGSSGDGNGVGIHSISDFSVISNNRLTNIGYSGIVFNGIKTIVERNHVNNFCLIKNDGGGIYTYQGSNNKPNFGRIIKENIIENGVGSISGTNMGEHISSPQVEGIYLDDNASGISVIGNTVYKVSRNGIHIHNGRNIHLLQNLIANCLIQLSLSDDQLGNQIENIRIEENQFAAFSDKQSLVSISSNVENHASMAEFRSNIYISPEGHDLIFLTKKQRENNDFDTKYNDLEMIRVFGIKEESPSRVQLLTDDKWEKKASDSLTELKSIKPSSFRSYGEGGEISTDKEQTILHFEKSFSAVAVDFPPISDKQSYQISFTAHTEKPQILQFILRLNGRPWTNLSQIHPLMVSPEKKEYSFQFDRTENGARALLLIYSQEASENIGIMNLQLKTFPLHNTKSQPYLYFNLTKEEILIPYSTNTPIHSENNQNSHLLKPFRSILLDKQID